MGLIYLISASAKSWDSSFWQKVLFAVLFAERGFLHQLRFNSSTLMGPVLILPFPVLSCTIRIKQVKEEEEPKQRNESLSETELRWGLGVKGESVCACALQGGAKVRKEKEKSSASVFPTNMFSVLPWYEPLVTRPIPQSCKEISKFLLQDHQYFFCLNIIWRDRQDDCSYLPLFCASSDSYSLFNHVCKQNTSLYISRGSRVIVMMHGSPLSPSH